MNQTGIQILQDRTKKGEMHISIFAYFPESGMSDKAVFLSMFQDK